MLLDHFIHVFTHSLIHWSEGEDLHAVRISHFPFHTDKLAHYALDNFRESALVILATIRNFDPTSWARTEAAALERLGLAHGAQ